MNKIILTGRLTADAELNHVGENGKIKLSFILAVPREFLNSNKEREADFVPVVLWNKGAEKLQKYLTKGRMINVTGRLNISSYDGEGGNRKYMTQVIASEINFMDTKKNEVV
jgi:single-strand DNA-binding protein